MEGMSQQRMQSTGIKVSQSPGGKSTFAFSYPPSPKPIRSVVIYSSISYLPANLPSLGIVWKKSNPEKLRN